jgi:hypothetical protein
MSDIKSKDKVNGGNGKNTVGVPSQRDSSGRFIKGNMSGNKFQKGYAGRPVGARNKKTVLARVFAENVLYLDPETGKRMSYKQLCLYIKKKADKSPRILNLLNPLREYNKSRE